MLPKVGATRRDPYHALVAEAMLQQTQVSRVIEKYAAFVARFPTVLDLARADEQDVLAMWTGLGYYRRAQHLHAAARTIVDDFGGCVPSDVESLRSLKGVGRYTAGAIASLAFDEPAPIVDGNVARVLLRVHGKDAASDDADIQEWLWSTAQALAAATDHPGDVNEGLMELGATICVPAPSRPACERCPIAVACAARASRSQMEIPRPKTRGARAEVTCVALRVTRSDGAVLLVRRPARGMWANMWQVPTAEHAGLEVDLDASVQQLAQSLGVHIKRSRVAESFEFLATHRRMMFHVFRATDRGSARSVVSGPRHTDCSEPQSVARFVLLEQAAELPMSSPQRRIVLGSEAR
ncbi:MAG: NUDIX domain-containing protein [Phycisphaerales bacterium]|nr:NUDIX domain-containing protein [Phycisphaerales bacterium]